MKKVLHITLKMSFGGMGKMISSWIHNIDDKRFQCDLLHQGIVNEHAQRQVDDLQAIGCNIYAMTFRYRQVLKRYSFIKKLIKANEYDVVHVHTSSPFDVLLLVAAKHCGVKTRIMHSHNTNSHLYSLTKKISGAFVRLFVKRYVTHMVACSKEAGVGLFGRNKSVLEKLIVINNGVDTDLLRFDMRKREQMRKELKLIDKHVFGHVGRFAKEKNQTFLIDVFNEIKKVDKDSVLILIGDGDLKEQCMQKVEKLELTEDVFFLGNVYNVPDYLQAMDTFTIPSLWEGFGVVLIEAQCSGLPCLASDAIVDEAIITDYVKKYKLDIPAPAWAKQALELVNDDEVRKQAYLRVEHAGLSIKSNVEVLQKLYSQN